MQEIYKDIVGYEGLYQVSNLGNVKSLRYGKERILKPGASKGDYLSIVLYKNNKKNTCKIHKIIANAFIFNPFNKPCVNHINGNKLDNRIENLEWCTYSENTKHAFNIGLNIGHKGQIHGRSKLTNEQVLEIRNDKRKQKEIAKYYNVSQAVISAIKRKKSWNHI